MPSVNDRASKELNRPQSAHDPELMQKLLHFVRQELRHVDAQDEAYVDERLVVFRRAFGHFIAAYGAYSPLLLAVQEAYESALHYARSRSLGVDALTERLALLQDETRQLLASVRSDAQAEKQSLADQIAERDRCIESANADVNELRQDVQRLTAELLKSKKLRDDMEMSNMELSKSIELWQFETADVRMKARGDDQEMLRLQRELKEAKQREITLLQEDMETREAFAATKAELEEVKSSSVGKDQLRLSQDNLSRCQAELRKSNAERDELSRLLAGGENRLLYPNGLEWAAEQTSSVAYLDPGWRGQRASGVISQLVEDLLRLHQSGGGGASAASAASAAPQPAQALPPLFTLDEDEFSDAAANPGGNSSDGGGGGGQPPGGPFAVSLLRGRVSAVREKAGSSFDGFVRLRPELWPVEEVRATVYKLWQDFKRKMAPGGIGARRPFGAEDTTAATLQELTAAFLTARHHSLEEAAASGQAVSTAAESAIEATKSGKRRGSYGSKKEKKEMHKGLLCADTYNLHAAMWGCRDVEPQAALFLQVVLGRLPPSSFLEVHKVLTSFYRSLTSAAKNDRVPMATVLEKLPPLLLGAPASKRADLLHAIQLDGGGPTAENAKLTSFEPPPKEPCEGSARLGPVGCEMQKLCLWMALTLRDDVEASLRRSALAYTLEQAGLAAPPKVFDPSAAGNPEAYGVDSALLLDASFARLPPPVARAALLRVDAATPEPVLNECLTRVYGEAFLQAYAAAAAATAEAASDEAAAAAAAAAVPPPSPSPPSLEDAPTLSALLSRLFAEPLRRFSARVDSDLASKVEAALRAAQGKAGKKGKGKKAKPGEIVVLGVPIALVREAILKADPARPAFEAEWLAAKCIEAGRAAAAKVHNAEVAAAVNALPPDQAPLEAIVTELNSALVQVTSTRSDAPQPTSWRSGA